jgi:hypothetical protein
MINLAKDLLANSGILTFLARLPFVKCALLRLGILQGSLDALQIVRYEDKISCRSPLYHKKILFAEEGHDRVRQAVAADHPLLVARLGAFELACLRFYLEQRRKGKRPYPDDIRSVMGNNTGFFPTDDGSLDAFCELYLQAARQTDIMAVWFNHYEDVICRTGCPAASLVELSCLEPFHFARPWTAALSGKKVLVIHPFAESISSQYRHKRELLFADPEVLPEFELTTIKAVQSIAGSPVPFASWFEAYRHMCEEMSATDFDVCLIGAGAYGLPLAAFAKGLGKKAIHLGGVTQILFGIKGRRWEEDYTDTTARLFNEHWVRPLPSETPTGKDKVEEGCYW